MTDQRGIFSLVISGVQTISVTPVVPTRESLVAASANQELSVAMVTVILAINLI
jgi:hypothetical protein